MTERPRVDVGVVTYNTGELTADALRRLLGSDQGCDLRVLVRDNASTDGTADAVARLVPEAEVERGTANLGFGAGMNTLLARSDAPWFLALNSDAWPDPGAIGTLVAAAEGAPRAAAVAPRLERPDGALEHSTYPFPSVRLSLSTALAGGRWLPAKVRDRMLLDGGWLHDRPRDVDWAFGAALLMRRAAVTDIGGFDERFFMYAEDLEWCWRAHRRGWTIRFEPAAIVRHVGNASGRAVYGATRTDAYMRNTYRFYRGEHGRAATLLYRTVNAGVAVTNLGIDSVRGRRGRARWWAGQLRSHLRPVGGPDGPPGQGP